jgi:hypothetical protein
MLRFCGHSLGSLGKVGGFSHNLFSFSLWGWRCFYLFGDLYDYGCLDLGGWLLQNGIGRSTRQDAGQHDVSCHNEDQK